MTTTRTDAYIGTDIFVESERRHYPVIIISLQAMCKHSFLITI